MWVAAQAAAVVVVEARLVRVLVGKVIMVEHRLLTHLVAVAVAVQVR